MMLNLDPQAGHEQAGRRPALVLSPRSYNELVGLAIVCPITKETKGYIFEVAVPANPNVYGFILADHVKSIDWVARKATLKAHVGESAIQQVLNLIAPLLGF